MKRPLILLALGCFLAETAPGASSLTIYVATNGNDRWSGRLAAPNDKSTDGPLATLEAGLQAARGARPNNAAAAEGITILLRGGTYELIKPIELTPQDSGTGAKQPFTIANYPGETPMLSGGRRITGWKQVEGQPGLWQAEVPPTREGKWYFRSLFINGRRATRARTPNAGSFFVMQGERFIDKPVHFKFKAGDIKSAWAMDPDAELIAFEKWTDFRQHIRAVLVESNVVRLSGEGGSHTREAGARYFIENTADSLDAPGEWHLDRQAGMVRYRPRGGEELSQADVIAPRLHDLFVLKGDMSAKKPVRHVVLRGLTFSFTDWELPEEGYTDRQAAVHVRGDLQAEAAIDCAIVDCKFTHLGGYALEFGRGCQRNRVVANEISDIGAGGVRLGETANKNPDPFDATYGHVIADNHLHALGRVYAPAVGVLVLQSGTNRIAHNHIHDLYYSALSIGWNWGYQETPCRENRIEYNHLHDIGQFMLSDMGAVYTLGIQRGTMIRNNLIHDVNSFTYGGWGLYTDEGSSDMVLESNVVYRCKSAGFHQHYGRENIVRNNIFAFNKEHQLMRSREEEHVSFFFTNNIVYFDSGDLLGSTWQNDRFVTEGNIYWDTRFKGETPALRFANVTLEEWRRRGHDTNSIMANPLFVAPEKFDFRLADNSPAFKLGFKAIDLSDVGPRPKSRREAP